tara:strand:+ start:243 stop:497 length:255 start_codon:yes stop_codon:yes gene_type:complete
MDKPIVFATEVPNNSIPIAKPVPIHPTLASAPPIHDVYPSPPLPSQMNRHTTVYVETRDRSESCDDLCSILLCCCIIQSLSDQM